MKTTNTLLAALIGLGTLGTAQAQNVAPWIKADSEINFDWTGKKSEDYDLRVRMDSVFRFEVIAREGVKAVVKARIEQLIYENGDFVTLQDLDWERVIEDAYIQIETDKLTGMPRAIVTFGKQYQVAFGQAVEQTPMFRDSLLYQLSTEQEVIGLTVELPTKFLQVIDSVAMSVYETGAEDFQIADEMGGSIKLSKKLMRVLEAQASALIKENAGYVDNETRYSMGFVFTAPGGAVQVWAQGLIFQHNPGLPATEWGAQVGASAKLGPGAVIIDWQYLENHAHELAVAYSIPVGQHLVFAPEVRQVWDLGGVGSDETRVGVRTRLQYSKEIGKRLKPKPMF